MARKPEQVVEQIPVSKLFVASFHRRTRWGNMKDLAASIETSGVLVPLSVRPPAKGLYEINKGARRWKGAQMAGLKEVPCIVKEIDDVDAIIEQLRENKDREPLHALDEAEYYDELTRMGLSPGDIAKQFRIKKVDVQRKLMLMALAPAARRAFAADKIDEAAAFALCRMDSVDKQNDVIAAHSSGALQTEEIPGYVSRMFTASLDDVPWRMTDEDLVPAAGACSACPKKSDVQRDMFGGYAKGTRCLDVDCHRSKMDATWSIARSRPDVNIHEHSAEDTFALSAGSARPVVMHSSGMVDLDAGCKFVPGKTWGEAIDAAFSGKPEAERPTQYLARDQDGRPRTLVREATATRVVKKSDAAREAVEAAQAADPVGTAGQRAETKARKALIVKLAEIATSAEMDSWGWVVSRIVENASARSHRDAANLPALAETIRTLPLAEGEVPPVGKAALLRLAEQSNRQARRVATAVLIFEDAEIVGPPNEAMRSLAATCDVDISEFEATAKSDGPAEQ